MRHFTCGQELSVGKEKDDSHYLHLLDELIEGYFKLGLSFVHPLFKE